MSAFKESEKSAFRASKWVHVGRQKADSLMHTQTHKHPHAQAHKHVQTHALPRTATHCDTRQHTATHCNTLQHTATHCNIMLPCNTLQRNTYRSKLCALVMACKESPCCSVLQCVAECCSALQSVVECCRVLQRVAACCSVLQCAAVCWRP